MAVERGEGVEIVGRRRSLRAGRGGGHRRGQRSRLHADARNRRAADAGRRRSSGSCPAYPCPCAAAMSGREGTGWSFGSRDRRPPRRPRIIRLYPERDAAVRVPDRERSGGVQASGLALSRLLRRIALRECPRRPQGRKFDGARGGRAALGAPRQVFEFDLRERRRNARSAWATAGSTTRECASPSRRVSSIVVRRPQDFGAVISAVSCQFVAAARAAHAPQNPLVDQSLQNRLEMARRQSVSRCQAFRRYRADVRIDGDVNHRCDGQRSLSGQQRHAREYYAWVMFISSKLDGAVQPKLAIALFAAG